MANNVEFDTSEWIKGFARLEAEVEKAGNQALQDIADELLRLSAREVPHNKGILMGSADQEPVSDEEIIVGYNKVYAARLHEHPEYRFQKGRKGKYLIDPLLKNLSSFAVYLNNRLGKILT